ncbi:MAG: PIN domain-containing protein [Actinomycetota bacterium]
MIFLDTNIFLRYFEKEDEKISKKAEELFSDIVSGKIKATSNAMVIAEIVWVLDRFYGWQKDEICENVELILNTPNISFKEKAVLLKAIAVFNDNNIDFIGAYNYAYMKAANVDKIYSYDNHYDKLFGLTRLKP